MRELLVDNGIQVQQELQKLIAGKIEDAFYYIHKTPLVIPSKTNDVNVEYCTANNIPIVSAFNMGGTIVANTGDIDIAIFKYNGWNMGKDFLSYLKYNLSKFIPNIKIDGNDLIADNKYKIVSHASINLGSGFIYTVIHISMNPNIEQIQNICSKPMVKIPKGLSDYGFTTHDITTLISGFNNYILDKE